MFIGCILKIAAIKDRDDDILSDKFGNIKVGGWVTKSRVMKFCLKNNFEGMEFLSGIPGTIAGGIKTNCGTKDEFIGSKIHSIEILDEHGNKRLIQKKDLHFGYRDFKCSFNAKYSPIIWVKLKLRKEYPSRILKKIIDYKHKRIESQPRGKSLGSIFKNPKGDYAGRIIEKLNLKGLKKGDAYISEKHANFIINRGEAKFKDVMYLINLIKRKSLREMGVKLNLEIEIFKN